MALTDTSEQIHEKRAVALIREIIAWKQKGQHGKSPMQNYRIHEADIAHYEKRAEQYAAAEQRWKEARDKGDWSEANTQSYKMRVAVDDFVLLLGKNWGVRADARPSTRIATPRK